jgi:hypothetical protein
MAYHALQMQRAIDKCSPIQQITSYLSPTHRTTCVTPTAANVMREATSMLHAITNTGTR